MARPNAKRQQAGWIAFGIACAFALMGMFVSPRAMPDAASGVTLPMRQIYMTAFLGVLTLASALISAVLLVRPTRLTRLRNLTTLLLLLVVMLIGLFELNWARDLL